MRVKYTLTDRAACTNSSVRSQVVDGNNYYIFGDRVFDVAKIQCKHFKAMSRDEDKSMTLYSTCQQAADVRECRYSHCAYEVGPSCHMFEAPGISRLSCDT